VLHGFYFSKSSKLEVEIWQTDENMKSLKYRTI